MSTTVVTTGTEGKTWGGGNEPLKASYGKMMMWFFIVSDALTFSGFLAAYGFSRFKFIETWPIADEVFTHVPFLHGQELPMIYVAFMTFVLIMSSVTMVLAVDAGHHLNKAKVTIYMLLTIIGGLIFVGSQAWEWATFIKGDFGAVQTKGGNILQFVDADGHRVALRDFVVSDAHKERTAHERKNGLWFVSEGTLPTYTVDEVIQGLESHPNVLVRTQDINEHGHKTVLSREESLKQIKTNGKQVVEGANLHVNEYGSPLFADFFFFITGFHGFHVFSGVVINIIIFFNVILGTYEKRKNYEMVEKVGLYWHFVDLVWVFVFTFFYLV
ncbi:MAG: cytochrome oxidase subunit III [Flavobacteriales bacterium]|nr:cytochrome oxidase subunit III [Flavobacteriia bacterium]NCP06563.1 cytochrome oxidase subunit III [Flavobacteriales bacterium]PIV94343.1 MAG: cytochrome oxidase subunit III [Flavobacteriaceae bacterium CG17_big_fil_post_rev_8_21_14_2_50_33_15]PIY10401.1 MAG: cytochrome oxidase subunit III [Flavobacteriaceae bacterium CG_4_10_14_3_um_filter_33_47]PJB20442.1 MAG: cytochrome oxidase subunit III [Flavobacteriaceae bacterium CG_4_9_14_3_um_filter_33_16]